MSHQTPDQLAHAAQRELDDAQRLHDALRQRVLDGDADVTVDQLSAQADLVAFAELRVQAAGRAYDRLSADQRREQYRQIADEARAVATIGTTDLRRKLETATAAIGDLYAAAVDHSDRASAVIGRASDALGQAVQHREVDVLQSVGLADLVDGHRMAMGLRVALDDGTQAQVNVTSTPVDVAVAAVAVALEAANARVRATDPGQYGSLLDAATSAFNTVPGIEPVDWRRTY